MKCSLRLKGNESKTPRTCVWGVFYALGFASQIVYARLDLAVDLVAD